MRINWIFCCILILLSIPASSAYIYEVYQGDTIYLGEIVDISRVMSWSGQFAYFTNGQPGDYPAKIVDVNEDGHMYNYYIDPAKYNVGTWYKWDGEKEPSGNMIAFIIAPGVRNNTYISQLNITPTKSVPSTTPAPTKEPKDTHLLLARGDTGTLKYTVPVDYRDHPQSYFWLFGTIPDYDLTRGSLMTSGTMLGIPMNYTSADAISSFTFTPEVSRGLQEGWYSGYIQFTGENGRQDVFYTANHKVGDSRYQILDTLYDDSLVPDVPIDGYTPIRVQQEFETLIKNTEYSDDTIIPISVEVVTPSITIGDYWEDNNTIVIKGSTPMSAGTVISVIIDPDHYALLPEIKAHTHKTVAGYREYGDTESECITTYRNLNNDGYNISVFNGTTYNITYSNGTYLNGVSLQNTISSKTKCTSIPRVYSITIPLNWNELSIGHHTIQATIDSNGIFTTSSKDFDITGTWINPQPVKELNKVVVVREGDSHQISIDNITPTVNITPTITAATTKPTEPEEIIVVGNPNATPKPTKTKPVITQTPPPAQKQPDNNWILWIFAVLAVIICAVYWFYNG